MECCLDGGSYAFTSTVFIYHFTNQVEFRMVTLHHGNRIPIRLIASNPTGYVLRVDMYVENRDASNDAPILTSVMGTCLALPLSVSPTADATLSAAGLRFGMSPPRAVIV